jgi:ribosomal protein S6
VSSKKRDRTKVVRHYETVIVLDPNLADADLATELESIVKIFEKCGAAQLTSDNWGKRELTFECRGHRMGNYFCYQFVVDRLSSLSNGAQSSGVIAGGFELPQELATLLRIREKILLFQTHRIEDRVRKFRGRPKKLSELDLYSSDDSDLEFEEELCVVPSAI